MSDALITGLIAIAVCLINNIFQAKQTEKTHNETVALIQYKIEELTRKVEQHNQVIERTYKLEESTALQEAELKRLNRRMEIVEGGKTA